MGTEGAGLSFCVQMGHAHALQVSRRPLVSGTHSLDAICQHTSVPLWETHPPAQALVPYWGPLVTLSFSKCLLGIKSVPGMGPGTGDAIMQTTTKTTTNPAWCSGQTFPATHP